MNANELADKIEYARNEIDFQRWANEAPDMLRQQQTREDSLCSMVKEYQDKVDELRNEIEVLKADNEQMFKALFKATRLIIRKAQKNERTA